MTKRSAPKRSSVYPYPPVSLILNGVKYKAGQKPARVCPVAAADKPLTVSERFLAEALSHTAADIRQLRAERAALRAGRQEGARGKRALRLEKQFDTLYQHNPDCSAEEIRRFKAPLNIRRMKPGTVANHWTAAKKRSRK